MSESDTARRKRARRRLPSGVTTGVVACADTDGTSRATQTERSFRGGARREIVVAGRPIETYLASHEMGWVISLDGWLRKLDLSAFTKRYSNMGPAPIHPRVIVGLILYGMLVRQWSLRELEALAIRDLGGWFLCNGEQPDHSTIGNFIQLHAETIGSEEWFVGLVRLLVNELHIGAGLAAIDGTVVESAASRLAMLSREAARAAASEAASKAAAAPDDTHAKLAAEQTGLAAQLADQRTEQREEKGTAKQGARIVSPSDPESVFQPRKDGAMRPSYKPSILAIGGRIIAGIHVDPSNETFAVEPLLEQHRAIFGLYPRTALLDAGYYNTTVLTFAVSINLDVLIPSGQALTDEDWEKKSQTKQFAKHLFVFQPESDVYRCPSGRTLEFEGKDVDRHGLPTRIYRGTQCGDCPMRARCTVAKEGRKLTRYAADELKEALATTMRHPLAREQYRRRAPIVEPVFAELRERQNLRRFHRRGLTGVRAEFALHCIAFNLKRAGRLQAVFVALRISTQSPTGDHIALLIVGWLAQGGSPMR